MLLVAGLGGLIVAGLSAGRLLYGRLRQETRRLEAGPLRDAVVDAAWASMLDLRDGRSRDLVDYYDEFARTGRRPVAARHGRRRSDADNTGSLALSLLAALVPADALPIGTASRPAWRLLSDRAPSAARAAQLILAVDDARQRRRMQPSRSVWSGLLPTVLGRWSGPGRRSRPGQGAAAVAALPRQRGKAAPKVQRGKAAPKVQRGPAAPKVHAGKQASKVQAGKPAPKVQRGKQVPKVVHALRPPKVTPVIRMTSDRLAADGDPLGAGARSERARLLGEPGPTPDLDRDAGLVSRVDVIDLDALDLDRTLDLEAMTGAGPRVSPLDALLGSGPVAEVDQIDDDVFDVELSDDSPFDVILSDDKTFDVVVSHDKTFDVVVSDDSPSDAILPPEAPLDVELTGEGSDVEPTGERSDDEDSRCKEKDDQAGELVDLDDPQDRPDTQDVPDLPEPQGPPAVVQLDNPGDPPDSTEPVGLTEPADLTESADRTESADLTEPAGLDDESDPASVIPERERPTQQIQRVLPVPEPTPDPGKRTRSVDLRDGHFTPRHR